jgi:hypothetical protein
MTELSKIEAAASADKAGSNRPAARAVPWSQDFATGEHPDTARHRIQQEFVLAVSALSRETLDRKYAYLQRLIDRAKEELGHARSASNEMRMAAMQQNIDELVAYVDGYGIRAKLPNRNGENGSIAISSFYVLEEIPYFLGELTFQIDVWYDTELAKVHDELLKLTGLAARVA